MGRSKETYNKKDVRSKQLKKRKDKEKRKQAKKEQGKNNFDDMIAWVDENGQLCSEPPTQERQEVDAESIEVSVPKGNQVKESQNKGRVKSYDDTKGYGFISSSQYRDSLFFHVNDCIDEVSTGDNVEFETEKGHKGLKAINVKKVK